MRTLWDTLGVPPTRIPIDMSVFVSYILPPFLCYLMAAVLVLMPHTRIARSALWPVFVLLALRAAASVTISNGKPELMVLDGYFYRAMFNLSARTLEWAVTKEPLVRLIRPAHCSPSVIMDTFDLVVNIRGYGWDWSHGFSFPRDTRPKNRVAFALYVSLSAVAHFFLLGICQQSILSFRCPGSTTNRFRFFGETLSLSIQHILPPHRDYVWNLTKESIFIRTSMIAALDYTLNYCSLQGGYDIATLFGVFVVGQEPDQWPPMFDAPWRPTSLAEFWGRKWHQWFRNISFFLGLR